MAFPTQWEWGDWQFCKHWIFHLVIGPRGMREWLEPGKLKWLSSLNSNSSWYPGTGMFFPSFGNGENEKKLWKSGDCSNLGTLNREGMVSSWSGRCSFQFYYGLVSGKGGAIPSLWKSRDSQEFSVMRLFQIESWVGILGRLLATACELNVRNNYHGRWKKLTLILENTVKTNLASWSCSPHLFSLGIC